MNKFDPIIDPDIIAAFLDEAPGYVAVLDEGLLTLERISKTGVSVLKDADGRTQLNDMFRAAHSFKGLAASLGFDHIRDLTHRMETLFDRIRNGQHELDAKTVQTLFGVFDTLNRLVQELTVPQEVPTVIQGALTALDAIMEASAPDHAPMAHAPVPVESTAPADAGPRTANRAEAPASTPSSVEQDPDTIQLFVETTLETLEQLTAALFALKSAPDNLDLINSAFRAAHNIKGATGIVGLRSLYALTHDLETVLDRIRLGSLGFDDAVMTAMFAAIDMLKAGVQLVRDEGKTDDSSADRVKLFDKWISAAAANSIVSSADDEQKPSVKPPSTPDSHDIVTVTFPPNYADAPIQAYLILNRLRELAEVFETIPDIDALDANSSLGQVQYKIQANVTADEIKEAISKYTAGQIFVSERTPDTQAEANVSPAAAAAMACASPPPAAVEIHATPHEDSGARLTAGAESAPVVDKAAREPVSSAATTGANAPPKAVETIRVDLERLDQLMNLGGELVISKARLFQIRSRLEAMCGQGNAHYLIDGIAERIQRLQVDIGRKSPSGAADQLPTDFAGHVVALAQDFASVRALIEQVHACRPIMNDFSEALHGLGRVSDGIQKRIMETRMVAVGPLFQRFRRVVRDLSKATGKEVELVLHGEATELDKRMIDELGDPLTHMIRNCVDHGIETPEQRRQSGKPPVACVTLDAYHRGRHICIVVQDDGKGVNLDAVKRKIIEKQLATALDVERMTDKELVQFIFKPGFSTAEKVTDLSGRGMGMDIVLNKLDMLNGTVDVDSVHGVGTTVTIRLPLTMAIIQAILVRIGDGVYAIPLESVAEIISLAQHAVQYVARRRVTRVRDRVIRVAFFEEVFSGTGPELRTRSKCDPQMTLLILSAQNEQIGLAVDAMIGQEEADS